MTARMRQTLDQAGKAGPAGLRRVHDNRPGQPPWPAHPATLTALARHGHLEHHRLRNRRGYPVDVWAITPEGLLALEPKRRVRTDRPLYLQRRVWHGGDYTRNRADAIDRLEVVPPGEIDPGWGRAARVRHADAQDRRERARRLKAA